MVDLSVLKLSPFFTVFNHSLSQLIFPVILQKEKKLSMRIKDQLWKSNVLNQKQVEIFQGICLLA
jgi:hypothetical protein